MAVRYAQKFSVDAVVCGHIHSAAIRKFGGVTYYNCGDWVETCSALIEQHDGKIDIVRNPPSAKRVQTQPRLRELIGSGA